MNVVWGMLFIMFLLLTHFVYQQAWVKQKRLQTQRQLLLLQNNLRDKLVEIESDADDQTINAVLMIDDGLNCAYQSLDKLSLSYYLKYMFRTMEERTQVEKDREANFFNRLNQVNQPYLFDVVKQTDELLYQQLKWNALLAVLTLAPIACLFWGLMSFVDAIKRRHKKTLQRMKTDMFWDIQQV
ncbi:hypothetical protein P3521_19855 [Vibrio parahaemolyticus]|uniref:hypothetical protein n=1 Tax=Vibrio parahaemolyticus TaxID=670 RepID=UPI00186A4576|nr:hypothetical protein [Vibrio parahaemolyticus]MBE3793583.1 hypothetical protein [Vibrio parahaemolyticus]MBE3866444.1 hypothetical protein [Vibrio parahaemolyticus]MCC3796968.1 hypothetical protein [Vibrio parahaemolyticus]MCC3811555.1 hypothetical protein [Vibrio parahaemolyticus]MCR9727915.1 hypothetical protein [Vibrio parahaemolyticus]